MGEQVKPQSKRSIDEIIEHMTADVQTSDGQYVPLGLTPPQTPVSAPHVWSEYPSMSTSNTAPVHSYIPHPQIISNSGDNQVYFTDFPSPYEVDLTTHLSKQNEIPQQNFYYAPQQQMGMLTENHEVIRTVMDVGGGNLVMYSGRSGEPPSGMIPQAYHMVTHDTCEPLTHPLGGFVPYHQTGVLENSSSSPMKDYGLFGGSELQHLQQQQQQQQQQQHQQQLQQHHVQQQQIQQQQVQQLQQQQLHQQLQQQKQNQSRQMQHSQHSPHFQSLRSNNQAQLIENLVGNWVPNQSGTYSPFGCADNGTKTVSTTNQQTTQTVKTGDNLDVDSEGKGMGRNPRKTRIVAEVRPMRPSYSDVLAKSAPLSNSHSSSKQNFNSQTINPMKSDGGGNSSKIKNTPTAKTNGKKSKNGLLKRQHSSGSDEHNGTWNPTSTKAVQSPLTTRKSVGSDIKQSSSSSGCSLPRKWVSLDDLDDPQIDIDVFDTDGILPTEDDSIHGKDEAELLTLRKAVGVASPRMKNGQAEDKWDGIGATLNNHKQTTFVSGGKGSLGHSVTKRPIHINNNLGTSQWASGNGTGSGISSGSLGNSNGTGNLSTTSPNVSGEKNLVKGGSKPCKSCGDEKKANSSGSSVSNKPASSGASSTRTSSRNNSSNSQGGTVSSDKTTQSKRSQRNKKKDLQSPIYLFYRRVHQQLTQWGRFAILALMWFLHLLSDVLGMSGRLLAHLCVFSWDWLRLWWAQLVQRVSALCLRVRLIDWLGSSRQGRKHWWQFWRRKGSTTAGNDSRGSTGSDSGSSSHFKDGFPPGLEANIPLPSTGEEAMKRLLACKGKDPYSILGVTPHSTDDDIKKYYKRQAFLVHPDKNNQPGAEEAFKILVHAFELIGEPERRKAYDHRVAETQQVEQAWSELSDLLSQLHQKMEYAANTIRCTNCGKRHRRISVDRPCYAARLCSQCKIHHAAREGDIWAESSMLGFLWHYYACMDGAVYDITEWAACQADNLRHLRANTHSVQYRIVLGRQSQSSNSHQVPPSHHHRRGGVGSGSGAPGSSHRRSQPSASREPDLEDFLNNLYNQSGGGGTTDSAGARNDQARHRRKGKRKK